MLALLSFFFADLNKSCGASTKELSELFLRRSLWKLWIVLVRRPHVKNHSERMESTVKHKSRIAILIPCHNEELTITEVVVSFRRELPDSDIYVFDNNSTDRTSSLHSPPAQRFYASRDKEKVLLSRLCFALSRLTST